MALRENTGIISLANREGGQHQDVDLGMAEDPEEVHPEHRRAAGLSVEEMAAEIAVDQQHHLRGGERSDGDQGQPADHSMSQTNSGMRISVMPVQRMETMVAMMLMAVPSVPNPLTMRPAPSSRCCARGRTPSRSAAHRPTSRHPARCPLPYRPIAADKAEIQEKSAERGHPEAEGVQARKRHVARADHQRHQIIARSRRESACPRERPSWCRAW